MDEKEINEILIRSSDSVFEKDYSAAEKILLEGLDRYRDSYLLHYNLGVLYLGKGMAEKALSSLLEAEKLFQSDPDVYIEQALAWQRTGRAEKALHCYSRALQLPLSSHQEAVIHNNRGAVFFDQGSYGKAAECFRKSLSIEQDYEDARQNLLLANTYLDITGKKE